MKAAQFFAKKDIRVVDVPEPTAKEGEALIEIEWCGICGSDLHEYEHGPMGIPVKERPHPATGEGLPVTMGHEFSGRIVSAPSGSNLSPGQKVMVDPRIYCSDCTRCSIGENQGCTTLGFKGLSGSGGGFSSLVAVNAKSCFPLPESTDLSLAAVIEPLTVAWHAVKLCEISDWSTRSVLVVGGGPVGIAHLFVLRSLGCKQIYVSEPSSARAAQNEKWAEAVINPIKENIGDRCRSLTGGEGVDVVFDCAGNQKGFDAGMDAVKFKGIYMNVASWLGQQMAIPFVHFMVKEVVLKCSFAYNDQDFRETVEAFVSGKFKGVEDMVTSRIHIDDVSTKGFDELVNHKDKHIKILVTPKELQA